jgi:hypothetical protein
MEIVTEIFNFIFTLSLLAGSFWVGGLMFGMGFVFCTKNFFKNATFCLHVNFDQVTESLLGKILEEKK